ncbi:MAG: AMP-binding protein [Rhodocyclales bacterium]|nr:AMP-binding protein [Rhodocyclales bacterium]
MLALVETLVGELRPAAPVKAALDSRLDRDLGLDSLALVELLARIEAAFGVRLDEQVLGSAETPRDLLAALAAGGIPIDAKPHVAAAVAATVVVEGLPATANTLVDVLQWHAARHPERTHVVFREGGQDGALLSYGELLAGAREVATGLRRRGIRPTERVALMLPSGLDFFLAFYGVLLAGAVPVPIYPPTRPAQVEDHLRRQAVILNNCEAVMLLGFDAARMAAHMLSGLVTSLRGIETVAALRAGGGAGEDYAGWPEEVAFLQYTSGSTGDPKGVTLDHGNLLANIRAWGEAVGLGPADVVVSWLPLYHDMGLIGAWLGSLYHACPLVLMSPLDFLARPERWLWAIHAHRGTVTAAPNFAFELCLRHADPQRLQGLDLSSWRYAANGAEPVAAETLARFAAAFRPYGFHASALAPVYGLAECSVGLAVSPPGRGPVIVRVQRAALAEGQAVAAAADDAEAVRLVACGLPLPGHRLRIVGFEGEELPPRRIGRIEFCGPSATRGYWNNTEASARLIRDGWLDSGDLGYLADGDVVITGRAKDMIIRGGRNLYPYELEESVGALPGVRRGCVAVFGVPVAEQGTEKLVVVAETRESAAEVRRAIVTRINELGIDLLGAPPDDVVLAPPHAVLKTSSGKIRRAATRELYLGAGFAHGERRLWAQVLRLAVAGLAQTGARRGRALVRIAYGGWAWMAGAVCLAPTLAVLLLPGPDLRWRAVRAVLRLAFALCGLTPRVRGQLASGPAVLVANHASYIDALLLAAVLPEPVAFVAKRELAGHPVLGPLLRRMGVHFVERADPRQGAEDARRLGGLADGPRLLFFAEGTFGPAAGLRAFRLGAFQVAAGRGIPVLPLTLTGTRELLRDGRWWPRRIRPGVDFGAPLVPHGADWTAVLALRDATRAAILANCGEPDALARSA